MVAAAYPVALTFATLLAISSTCTNEPSFSANMDVAPPFRAFVLFFVLLGCASLAFGVLNPETAALVGLDGIVAP